MSYKIINERLASISRYRIIFFFLLFFTEDENWGGDCDTGDKQSPVDLAFDASVRGHFPAFMFENYDEPIDKATVTNNGHSSELRIEFERPLLSFVFPSLSVQINVGRHILFGGGLPGTFLLDQMHFHWGSEHTINGRRYGLELHLVHHDNRYPSLKEAAGAKRGLAVLGVLSVHFKKFTRCSNFNNNPYSTGFTFRPNPTWS
jgi:carbonic anhydrase